MDFCWTINLTFVITHEEWHHATLNMNMRQCRRQFRRVPLGVTRDAEMRSLPLQLKWDLFLYNWKLFIRSDVIYRVALTICVGVSLYEFEMWSPCVSTDGVLTNSNYISPFCGCYYLPMPQPVNRLAMLVNIMYVQNLTNLTFSWYRKWSGLSYRSIIRWCGKDLCIRGFVRTWHPVGYDSRQIMLIHVHCDGTSVYLVSYSA